MGKRNNARSDTAAAATETAAKIQEAKPILPPESVPLDDEDMPFWDAVIAEFARTEWTDHSLQLAAVLARMLSDLVTEQKELREEGSICYTDKGTPVVNPRKTVIQMYGSTILSIRRSLSLHARAQGGEPRDKGKRRAAEKELEDALDDANEDALLGGAGMYH